MYANLGEIGQQIYGHGDGDVNVSTVLRCQRHKNTLMLVISGTFWTRYLVVNFWGDTSIIFDVLDIDEGNKPVDKVDVSATVGTVVWKFDSSIEENYSAIYRAAHPQS